MITTSITRPITSLIASAIAGAGAIRRWYLHWDGVDQYATHSAWSMSGYGDRIEFSFTADAPGTGDDYLLDSTDGENYLKVANTTAVLTLGFLDTDDSTSRTVTGPTVVAGTKYSGYIEFKADGVDLIVNGTTYDSANVPAIKDDLTHIAAETTPSAYFEGTIHYLRYTNATPLQGVNGVAGNGVDLSGTVPSITLTAATISFPLLYKSGNQTLLDGSVPVLTVASDLFVSGANVTALTVDGETYGSEALVDGQHYDVSVEVNGGTLTTIGLLASGAAMGTLTVEI